ncbi:MAG: DUF1918 domain-containing protein [Gaiellales bacterium]
MAQEAGDSGFFARPGDHVFVRRPGLRGAPREGEILEVRGRPGSEYYLVRWPRGRESLLHAGSDTVIPEAERRGQAADPADPKPRAGRRPGETPSRAPEPHEPFELHRRSESHLQATPGDRLVIRHHQLGRPDRDAEILEVLGPDGEPPYRVRWSDTGRETILRPGSDAYIDHLVSGST